MRNVYKSRTKNEHKPKLLSADIFQRGRGLPCEGGGGMSPETREIKIFGQDIPGFCRDVPVVPEKFEKTYFQFCQNCLQRGRSNLVEPAEWPKIRSLNRDLGKTIVDFSLENSKTQSSPNILQSGSWKFTIPQRMDRLHWFWTIGPSIIIPERRVLRLLRRPEEGTS